MFSLRLSAESIFFRSSLSNQPAPPSFPPLLSYAATVFDVKFKAAANVFIGR